VTGPESGQGVSLLTVTTEDMMKFKVNELHLELSYLLIVCRHAGVTTIRLPCVLVDDDLKVTTDVKRLDPELDSDAQAIDEGLIFDHVVCHAEI
jgi:hypothetical protein